MTIRDLFNKVEDLNEAIRVLNDVEISVSFRVNGVNEIAETWEDFCSFIAFDTGWHREETEELGGQRFREDITFKGVEIHFGRIKQ